MNVPLVTHLGIEEKDETSLKLEAQFLKKNRASIIVDVKIMDADGVETMQGEFGWFIQKMENELKI